MHCYTTITTTMIPISINQSGGYGIQGLGGQMVDRIDGCYFNVMGLPLSRLSRQLADLHKEGLL